MAGVYYIAELSLTQSQDELIEKMRELKAAREGGVSNVVCYFFGFDSDPRELWDIPEARAFCTRLVDCGLISYLDPSAGLSTDPAYPSVLKDYLGAVEIYLMSQGQSLASVPVTKQLIEDVNAALHRANEVADAIVGK